MEKTKTPNANPMTILLQEIIKMTSEVDKKDKDKEGYTTKDYLDALANRLDIVENAIGDIKISLYALEEQIAENEDEIARLDGDIDAIYSGSLARDDDSESDTEGDSLKVGGTESEEEKEDSDKEWWEYDVTKEDNKESPKSEDTEEPEDEILRVGGTESEEEADEKKEKSAFRFRYQCVVLDDKYKFDIVKDEEGNFYPDEDVWYPYCDSIVRRIAKNYDTETVVLYAFYDSNKTPNDAPYLLGSSSDRVMCGHFLYESYQGKMTIVSGPCSNVCPVKDFNEGAKADGCTVWFRLIGNHNKIPVAKDND